MRHPDPKAVRRWAILVFVGLALSMARAQDPETPAPDAPQAAPDAPAGADDAKKDAPATPDEKSPPAAPDSPTEAARSAAKKAAKRLGKAAEALEEVAGAGEADGAKKTDDAADDAEPLPFTKVPAPPLPTLDADGGRGLRVVVVPIDGTIDMGLAPFVDRVIAESKGAAAIILDVDTFGGRVDAAVKIRDALLATEIPVIAFVDKRAISAGALISLAADHIVFAPGGSMGAATPIQVQGGQAQAVGEKMVSYMRSEMRATAEANGRSGVLAEAMVDADIAVEGVIAKGKLLTVTTDEAVELGLATAKIANLDALLDALGLSSAELVKPTVNWGERVARFLTDPVVSGLLMSLGMLGLLLEFYTPGFGVAGGIGVLCLLLFFGGSSIAGLAGWEEAVLFALGTIALAVEVFIIPGFGVAGVLGIAMIGVALVLAMIDMPIGTSWEIGILGDAMVAVVISLLITTVLMIIVIRYLPGSFMGKWLVLEHTMGGTADGMQPDEGQPWEAAPEDTRRYRGLKGVSITPLRPSGKVRIGEDVVDVVSRDAWIDRDTPVKVVLTEGVRVVVIEDLNA